jgi:hypothetical protein
MGAKPAKLKDGTWGARVDGSAAVGDEITITANNGKTWRARVRAVLWTGEGVSLVATQSLDRPAGSSPRRKQRGARYCEGWGADNPHAPRPPYTCFECEE